jgi:hypothetical protein
MGEEETKERDIDWRSGRTNSLNRFEKSLVKLNQIYRDDNINLIAGQFPRAVVQAMTCCFK